MSSIPIPLIVNPTSTESNVSSLTDVVLNWTNNIGIVSIPLTCNKIIGTSEPTIIDDTNIGISALIGNAESFNVNCKTKMYWNRIRKF